MKRVTLILSLMVAAAQAPAMDRFAALSMLESGDNDRAIGAAGEVSRYQIRPRLWRKYGHGDPTNPHRAIRAVYLIMHDRANQFFHHYHRMPDDFEFYVLWNAPDQITHPDRVVTDRAQRFANLCSR